jgi:hypothetical protein
MEDPLNTPTEMLVGVLLSFLIGGLFIMLWTIISGIVRRIRGKHKK